MDGEPSVDGFGAFTAYCVCGFVTGAWSTKTRAVKELDEHLDEMGVTFRDRRAECFDRSRP